MSTKIIKQSFKTTFCDLSEKIVYLIYTFDRIDKTHPFKKKIFQNETGIIFSKAKRNKQSDRFRGDLRCQPGGKWREIRKKKKENKRKCGHAICTRRRYCEFVSITGVLPGYCWLWSCCVLCGSFWKCSIFLCWYNCAWIVCDMYSFFIKNVE